MSEWNSIRNEALRLRQEIAERAGLDPSTLIEPHRLVELAATHLDLELNKVAEDSPILEGSVAILRSDTIYFRHDLSDGYREYSIAHEIGHHVLHKSGANCSSEDIVEFSIDGETPTAVQQVEGYGKREKREREANLFALELLLPCEVVKQLFLSDDRCVSSLSRTTNLPRSFIFSQLSTALLTPLVTSEPKENAPRRDFELDESQSSAARAESGPLLVTAGPGTGKTQTLVKRVLFLLQEKKLAPEKILALTFSNKATREMRERIAEKAPDQAHRITVMTFHSYALELLRKYWHEAGLKADSEIIEKMDGILYLEEHLDELGLEYLQDLQEPTSNLSPILTNISRAKDELIGPSEFKLMAEEQLAEAQTEEEKEKAQKILETAGVYEFYQAYLEREQLLDFGELIFRAVKLLQGNKDIRTSLRSKYEAILVDEFQDINRASGVLVKEIAGDGKGLWAVGDLRQSIYRWRGASPNNINKFEEDYPGAKRISLDTNYRSCQNIVGMFSEFARSMQSVVEPSFPGWTPSSDATASIKYNVFGTLDEEADKIAEESKSLAVGGVPFRNQAVICRTNGQLDKLASRLVERGIPVLFLGDLFARSEIRDLLSLLDVRSSDTGTGLVRAGSLEPYSIPLNDINLILADANREGADFQGYLAGEELPQGISEDGRKGFTELRASFLDIPKDSSAFNALCELLFSDGQHLKSVLESDNEVLKAQNMLAIYQLVSFARSVEQRFADKGEGQIAAFLEHIRKLARFGEDKGFAQMPESAQEIDAVRLMTVHSSKGLEFDAVFIPFLVEGYFPNRRMGDSLPPPEKLSGKTESTHLEEEECLFFVAVSRAKKALILTRAEQYSETRSSKPSNFLGRLGSHLPTAVVSKTEVEGRELKTSGELIGKGKYHISQINRFDRCGREFYYRDVLKIEGKRKYSNPYQAFHKIVYDTLSAIQNVIKRGNTINEDAALAILDELWQLGEMDSKAYSKIYRHHAEDMVKIFVKRIGETTVEICKEKLEFEFENGVVSVTPEHLEIHTDGVLVRKFRTGKGSAKDDGKSETADLEEALLFLAAEKSFHGAPVKLIKTYLGSDTDREVALTDRVRSNRLKTFEDTLTAIRAQRFEPSPSDRRCPNCPYFFICPQ